MKAKIKNKNTKAVKSKNTKNNKKPVIAKNNKKNTTSKNQKLKSSNLKNIQLKNQQKVKQIKKKKRKPDPFENFEKISFGFMVLAFFVMLCVRIAGSNYNYALALKSQHIQQEIVAAKEKIGSLKGEIRRLEQYDRIMEICEGEGLKYIYENIYVLPAENEEVKKP